MFFNSLSFAIFLPVVFILYWFVAGKNVKTQNWLILVASYYFYASWNYKFLALLLFSTLLDYFSGIRMASAAGKRERKKWFLLSVIVNIGFLAIFKYYNFFAASFASMLSDFGLQVNMWSLNVILPVGISFYTFHGLSYVIDVYRGVITPEKNFVNYAVFVSFFPLLVAGPIERATHLLPQVKKMRTFNYSSAVDGLRQILWGLFKKIVIADTCAEFANPVFENYHLYNGSTLILGAFFFAFQIYCDFSGYSDIALGTARLFGIDLIRNFAFPYFSRDIAEFWRRWHISLTTWFRDYLYIPLGGSRGGVWSKTRNIFIIFLVSGFWHGANWTFIAWGAVNAMLFVPLLLLNRNRTHLEIVAQDSALPTLKEFFQIFLTFSLVTFTWVFFRSETVSDAFKYIGGIFSYSVLSPVDTSAFTSSNVHFGIALILVAFFTMIEWIGRRNDYALRRMFLQVATPARWTAYYFFVMCIFLFFGKEKQFIYFQF